MEMRKKILGTYALITVLITGILSAGMVGCNAIISSIDDTEEPVQDNPNDPNNPDAEPPQAVITSHDVSFINEINNHSITINWQPDESGITEGVEYQYRLAFPGQNIENQNWSPADSWLQETSLTYSFLDESFAGESQAYTFQVRARAIENPSKMQQTPAEFSFFINAVGDQGIVFNRRFINSNSSFTTEINLDEIEISDNLNAVQVDISYNTQRFAVDTSQIEVYTSQGLFTQSGGQIIGLKKVADQDSVGTVSLTIGFVNSGSGLSSVSGSGPVASVQFQPLDQDPFNEVIRIQSTSKFKRSDGSDLLISNGDYDEALLYRN